MKDFRYIGFVFCLLLISEFILAQPSPQPRHVDLALKEEKENLNVLQDWITWNNPGSLLINHFNKQAARYYEIRDEAISKLKTRDDWTQRQQEIKSKLTRIVGPFPEKTPLNVKVTGIVKKKGYRIEKIVYESFPGSYVTSCLFIPDNIKGKVPAVLDLIGHEQESFHAELDQVIILNLVKKGMIVFTIDPPGQGEHVQYFDPEIKLSSVGYSVIEHCYFGNQCFLSGSSAAKYFIWEAIRAIDYLVSRKEVDAERIGVTGFSGGGTVTSYVGALDERVKVAIPCSWSTASRRQLETKGAQDAEAEFLHGLIEGITLEDLIEVRAPKPTLMTFTSGDEYLTLQGAREAYDEILLAYTTLGTAGNLELVEDDSKHWLTPKIRQAIFSFFMKHFGIRGDPSEQEVELLTREELSVTSTGQIATSLGGKMIFDLNKSDTEKQIAKLVDSRKNVDKHLSSIAVKAKEISGFVAPADLKEEAFINGRYHRDGYTVGKYAIKGEGDYVIPVLFFVPDNRPAKSSAIIYLHPEGKNVEALRDGEIEKLVKQGYVVAAPDVLGVGETKNTATRGLAAGYTGVLIGRSVVGVQAGDIVRVARYLKSLSYVDTAMIGALARQGMCLPLVHAAAFDQSIKSVLLIDALISYRSVAMNRHYRIGLTPNEGGGTWHPYEVDFDWGIGGVLTAYDIPDLLACIAPRKVCLSNPRDQMLAIASESLIKEEMEFPKAAYNFSNASSAIRTSLGAETLLSLVDWCFAKH